MAQNPCNFRKKWQKNEISHIKHLRDRGLKLKDIAKNFQVTANAIRKTLTRHVPEYVTIKKTNNDHFLQLKSTVQQLITFGIKNNLITTDKNGFFYIDNVEKSKFQCVDYINKYRKMRNLHKILIIL